MSAPPEMRKQLPRAAHNQDTGLQWDVRSEGIHERLSTASARSPRALRARGRTARACGVALCSSHEQRPKRAASLRNVFARSAGVRGKTPQLWQAILHWQDGMGIVEVNRRIEDQTGKQRRKHIGHTHARMLDHDIRI